MSARLTCNLCGKEARDRFRVDDGTWYGLRLHYDAGELQSREIITGEAIPRAHAHVCRECIDLVLNLPRKMDLEKIGLSSNTYVEVPTAFGNIVFTSPRKLLIVEIKTLLSQALVGDITWTEFWLKFQSYVMDGEGVK